jgi:RNA polymerase sigma-70 factor, ECF subfamily
MESENTIDLAKVKAKDADELHSWVHEHHDDIFRFLRHLTRHRETAEDLAQQTFVNAFQAIGSFRGESSMRTWLHRIAFREYTGWRRKQKLLVPLEFLLPKIDRGYSAVETKEVLLGALHQLPPAYREAFLLFEVQQLSIEEISSITGSSVGTIKSRLHHSRHRLQGLLETSFLKEVSCEL